MIIPILIGTHLDKYWILAVRSVEALKVFASVTKKTWVRRLHHRRREVGLRKT
jgi:hypothetical protein